MLCLPCLDRLVIGDSSVDISVPGVKSHEVRVSDVIAGGSLRSVPGQRPIVPWEAKVWHKGGAT